MRNKLVIVAAAIALSMAISAGCSATTTPGATGDGNASGTTGGTGTSVQPTRPACQPPTPTPVEATAVAGVASDYDLTSFDGTKIRFHWFPLAEATANNPLPTILMGPGWSLPGDTNVSTAGVLSPMSITTLRTAGYNVLTWDPRGFGNSTGTSEVDSVDFEGKDVQRLMDWVATQPGVQLDTASDPRIGMVGASYGGGIQPVVASIDCRVDAIVPVVAWHSLVSSLYKAETHKAGWSGVLATVTRTRPVNEHVAHSNQTLFATGTIDPNDLEFFEQRGMRDVLSRVNIPTLFVQGTVDTLFTLDEAISNYRILRDRGIPTSMVWFCGGHGTCLTDPGDTARVNQAEVAWLNRYVKNDPTIDTGPRIKIIDQDGVGYNADDYPFAAAMKVTADGQGTLALNAGGGSGPIAAPASGAGVLDSLVAPITPAKAASAVNVGIDPGSPGATIVGAPQLKLTYRGTTPAGDFPTRVFAQIIDDSTGFVLGNQLTPIEVTLDGQTHETTVGLEIIAFTTKPGSHLTLQLVATTVAYGQPRLGGSVQFERIQIDLPVVSNLAQSKP